MKWLQMYLVGYVVVLGGLVAALWKMGVIERVGPGWTVIGIVIAVGLGLILVANSGNKETVRDRRETLSPATRADARSERSRP